MRREWSPWIKTRQWHEFERLAKTDPSQPLVDTVAELERGFPDKSDRRALRKILFLLGQAGYRPREIEEHEESDRRKESAETGEPAPVGFMLSAGYDGAETLIYGKPVGTRVRLLCAKVVPLRGIREANEIEEDAEGVTQRFADRLAGSAGDCTAGPVPAQYVRYRLSEEMRRTPGRLPTTIAFWRSELTGAPEVPHPAAAFPRAAELKLVWDLTREFHLTCIWRLELGAAAAAAHDLFQNEDGSPAPTLEQMVDHTAPKLITPEIVESRAAALDDLGYLCHCNGLPGGPEVLALADDLRVNGPSSAYARETASLTLLAFFKSMRDTKEESMQVAHAAGVKS